MRYLFVTALACACAFAQVRTGGLIDTNGTIDFTASATTKPNRTLTSDPSGACSKNNEVVLVNTNPPKHWACIAGTWAQLSGGTGSSTFVGLTDVTATGATDKQATFYDSATSKWVKRTIAGGPTGLLDFTTPWTPDFVTSGLYPLAFTWTGYHNFTGGTLSMPKTTFSALPSASSNADKEFRVTDCADATCAAGGGSTVAIKRSNGTTWQTLGGASTVNRIFQQELRFANAYSGSATASGGWSMIGSFTAPGGFVGIGDGANLNIAALKFSDAVTSHTYNMISIPQGFVSLGSRLNWTHTASSTGNADWRMSYMCIAAGTQYNAAPTWTEVSFSNTGAAASVTAGIVSTISSVVTSGGNCVGGNTMLLRFSKYTGDTFSTDPVAIGLVLDWTVNQ